MTITRLLRHVVTHGLAAAAGIAVGIYLLPILTEPPAPAADALAASQSRAIFHGEFTRERADSDRLHWGEGRIAIGPTEIGFVGRLAPGPDYALYLSPHFVETEAAFAQHRPAMVRVGAVPRFGDFVMTLPAGIDPAQYRSVIIWCDAFGEFITSAQYQ